MPMTADEKKARRMEGMQQMTVARRVHRRLVNGRPPAGEFKTPLAAVTAARSLYSEIERQLTAESLKPAPGELGVFIGYVPPDLSFLGHTALYSPGNDLLPGNDAALMEALNGKIVLGLVFGILDQETDGDESGFVVGTRSFVNMKQVDEWLSELKRVMEIEMDDTILDRKIQEQKVTAADTGAHAPHQRRSTRSLPVRK